MTEEEMYKMLPKIVDETLIVPYIDSIESAKAIERILEEKDLISKVEHLGKTAHISGGKSHKLLRNHLRQKFDIQISSDSITNLFSYINRRGDMLRSALARTSETSGLDKVIDTGLLTAYEDICIEYDSMSATVRGLASDDPTRPGLAKELRYLRSEMLKFKELIAPGVQKIDMKSEINQVTNDMNTALIDAVKAIG